MTDQALRIPLAQIDEHKDFRLRLEYEHIDELAQSFIETAKAEWKAGRTSSNGQQQPGRAILSASRDRWELYSGLRRRLAMQKAYETTKDPRFSYYWLCDDTGISREEMLRRALEDRSGIRENLTDLEEVRVFRLFRDVDFRKVVASGDQRERFSRLERVAKAFSDDTLASLHKIEANAGPYAFKLPTLEFLSGISEATDLYMTAAEIAVNRYDQSKKKMEEALAFRKETLGLQWFVTLFPSAVAGAQENGGVTTTTQGGAGRGSAGEGSSNSPSRSTDEEQKEEVDAKVPTAGKKKGKKNNKGAGTKPTATAGGGAGSQQPAPLLRLEDGVLTLACPFCGGPVLFRPGSVRFDGDRLSLEGKPSTPVAAEAMTGEFTDACELCGERFYYSVRLAEGQHYIRMEKRKKNGDDNNSDDKLVAAGKPIAPETILWDDAGSHWRVIDAERRVVRDLPAVPAKGTGKKQQREKGAEKEKKKGRRRK